MEYVPPHLRVNKPEISETKEFFSEKSDDMIVRTNSPYGKIESLNCLKCTSNLKFTTPTVIQKYAIPAALKNHPLQVRAPTGLGKTMCFLLPAIENIQPNNSIQICIISPTRELCDQIKEEAKKINNKISIACLYGGSYVSSYSLNVNIIVAAPGKLLNYLENNKISLKKVSTLVLDEADKLLEMGFERDVRKIKQFVNPLASVHLFSATYPKTLPAFIEEFLPPNKVVIEIQNETITNIKQEIIKVDNKDEALKKLLSENPKEKVLVFVAKKITAQELEAKVKEWGYSVVSIHGDKEQSVRQFSLSFFKKGHANILVATSVAARGIDVNDIKLVINYDFPGTIDDYIHRIGRTGRQGKDGLAVSFYREKDVNDSLRSAIIDVLKESKNEIPSFLTKNLRDTSKRSTSFSKGSVQKSSLKTTNSYGNKFTRSDDALGSFDPVNKLREMEISSSQTETKEKEDDDSDLANEW